MRVAALIATLALVIACSYGATTSYQVGSAMYDITGPAAEGLLFVCLFVVCLLNQLLSRLLLLLATMAGGGLI
jgi:hypothetical protein